jgi:hypothetical protein
MADPSALYAGFSQAADRVPTSDLGWDSASLEAQCFLEAQRFSEAQSFRGNQGEEPWQPFAR